MVVRRRSFALAVLFLIGSFAFVFTTSQGEASEETRPAALSPEVEPERVVLPGEVEVLALRAAYPQRVSHAEVRDGEWALEMDGRWFYWADGRLLPEELRAQANEFVPVDFSRYEPGPVRERDIEADREQVLRDRLERQHRRESGVRLRFNPFKDTLYQIGSWREAERVVQRIRFLGFSTRVHPFVVEPLAHVERTILAILPHDEEVAAFVDGLAAAHGYNWRLIAGTALRSYHSYGVAIDVMPRSYGRRFPYWLWAEQAGIEAWWDYTRTPRWKVPQAVIDAFEAHGFVWGGKWLYFDTLHFEYRPESFYIAGTRSGDESIQERYSAFF